MSRIRRCLVLGGFLAAAFVAAAGWQQPDGATAHDTIDQRNDVGPFNSASQIQFAEPIGQSFVPTSSELVGVAFLLEDFNPTGAATVTVRIRSGAIDGAILGETARVLPQNLPGFQMWVRFDLLAALKLTAGQTYVAEIDASNNAHGINSGADLYPNGNSFFQGNPSSGDLAFRTYTTPAVGGDVDCNGVVNSVDSLKILRHAAGLSVSQTEPCPDIGQIS